MGWLSLAPILLLGFLAIAGYVVSLPTPNSMASGMFASSNRKFDDAIRSRDKLLEDIDEMVSGRFQKRNGRTFSGKGRTVPLVFLSKPAKGRSFYQRQN